MELPGRLPSEQTTSLPVANAIKAAFDAYRHEFKRITRRAQTWFDARDWHAGQNDSVQRLDIYTRLIERTLRSLQPSIEDKLHHRSFWTSIKAEYGRLIETRDDRELAETFFNSVTRKLYRIVGVDPDLEFITTDPEAQPHSSAHPLCRVFRAGRATPKLVARILGSYRFKSPYQDLTRDAARVAASIEAQLLRSSGSPRIQGIEMVRPVFFRNKSAYLLGRIHVGGGAVPLVLPLLNEEEGIVVDTVLLSEDDTSILFSFTRSYFHVEVEAPRDLIQFLKEIMPRKPLAELYISIGHNKHGKTVFYRDLLQHLDASTDRFVFARGDRGMVMVVFTLPSYDVVFKIIRDTFAYPKTTVRQQVMDRYNLVFKHDRAGRLVDAQEFENLKFDKSRFEEDLLEELTTRAAESVKVEGDSVVISHLYVERRLAPLNLYIREADESSAREAVIDYGQTVKDLAATNIFPGDLLLKNFGVTRHGRVVFYDYDELCLLTDCNFRAMPESADPAEEMMADPWFFVGENDIFPEELIHFLGLKGTLLEAFLEAHSDLLGPMFWQAMQDRHRAGEIMDIFPYRQDRRFPAASPSANW